MYVFSDLFLFSPHTERKYVLWMKKCPKQKSSPQGLLFFFFFFFGLLLRELAISIEFLKVFLRLVLIQEMKAWGLKIS